MQVIKMKNPLLLLLPFLLTGAEAFSPSQKVRQPTPTFLFGQKQQNNNLWGNLMSSGASVATAATIFAGTLVTDLAMAPPAHAAVEISRGAFVIENSAGADQSLLKTQIDTKRLLKSLFINRNELSASLGRIQKSIQTELKTPAWAELSKEVLNIEGDVVSSVKFTQPVDWQQTVKDLSHGKLNFIYNGEIFNVVAEPNFSEEEDDLVFRVKGFKGEKMVGFVTEPEVEPFWAVLNAPFYPEVSMYDSTRGLWVTIPLSHVTSHLHHACS
jgi:hypothetical protein